jgi:hypothetical protein
MQHVSLGVDWWLTVIYGLSRDQDKVDFLIELDELRHLQSSPWLLTG